MTDAEKIAKLRFSLEETLTAVLILIALRGDNNSALDEITKRAEKALEETTR